MSDRLEDVIRGCVKQFASTSDFFTFAQSGTGLSLSVQDVTTIIENHRFSVEEQKKKLLWLWVERNAANATPEKIRDLVRQYYVAEQRDPAAHVGRIENVFQDVIMQFTSKKFEQFARSEQGLSLTEHEVDTITENNRFSVEERNLKLLFKWRQSRYPNTDDAAVIEKIKMVVGLYIQDANQVEKEQIIQEQDEAENEQLRGSVGSISEISENLKKPTPPETSAKAMANVKSNHEYLGMMANYVKQLFESVKEFSVKPPDPTRVSAVTPTQTTEVSEAKEFLEVVENSMKQMLESRLKPAMEKTKMEYFILPKVTEFKELEFNEQTSLQSVDITEIYSDSSVNHVMLLGDTGSGKTTFSMRYTMLALEKRLVFLEQIKMVYFVDVSKLQCGYPTTAFDLLFNQQLRLELSKRLHKVGQEWFKQNSKHILLVVDGLDEMKKPFENEYPRIGPETLSETNTIIANILSDHLYPGMKILSTTRWHVYWKLPSDLKATSNLALGGWDNETLNLLAGKLFGPEAKRIVGELRQKVPFLISNPMFFFYLVQVLKDSKASDIDTLTNLMVSVLRCFSESRHGRTVKSARKLMKLAFHGMKDNLFVFTTSYIESLNLDMKDVRGLVEMDADARFVEYVADDDDMIIRFSHQTLHEILASLYACTLDLDEFKRFFENSCQKPGMEVVIKHIFGIVLNKATSEKAAKYISVNLNIKFEEYLMGYLEKLLEGKFISDIEVVNLLHECGPDVIKEVCSQIEVMDLRIYKAGEQHTLLTVGENIGSLRTLNLFNLDIRPENYSSLQHVLGSVQNIQVNFFNLINCDPDAEKLRILYEAMTKINFKIEFEIAITESPSLEPLGYYYLIGLVNHGGSKWLSLKGGDLNTEKISKMNEAVINYGIKLDLLNIDENPNMDAEAFQQLEEFLKNTEVKRLHAEYCTPTSEQLSAICTSLENKNVKVSELLLARSTTESPTYDELLTVSRLVQRMKKFKFRFENLNASQIEDLAKKTHKLCPKVEIKHGSWGCFIRKITD